jgi:hypothetical protein
VQVPFRLVYRGDPPVHWAGDTSLFGVQDKDDRLMPATPLPDGGVAFDFSLVVAVNDAGAPDFAGPFAHGPRGGRFVYLSWRNATGAYAQRFKLPLDTVTAALIDQALGAGRPITGTLVIDRQRATKTGANVGGTRPIEWA